MTLVRITSTGILSLLLGIAAPAYAQHDQQSDKQDHHEQQQDKHQQAKPQAQHPQQHGQDHGNRPEHAQQQQRQEQNVRQEHAQQQHDQAIRHEHAQQQDQNNGQQHAREQQRHDQHNQPQPAQHQNLKRSPQQQRIQQSAWQRHESHNWESEHRTWQQRGGYHGYRIPDDRFRVYFGSNHGFRIYGQPFLVVGGYPRFQYQGYWFSPVDPWPVYWGNNWYDNDEVYVNYVDNGYYLYNRRYPNVGIAINISM